MSRAINQQARIQYSVHPPSRFLVSHQAKLLPDWSCPARSMLIVLQPCNCDLLERTLITEAQKRELRRQFFQFGYAIAAQIKRLGYTVAIFDPRTGLPLLSRPGALRLDDVAIVRAALGYQSIHSHGCAVVIHPLWGGAVYPSTLVSSIEPVLLEQILTRIETG
ncbi:MULTISPECIES: methylmalonic aciduria and homocystinuria type D protein [Cyanophyceae]|uniref:Methylmalonic aciduria and homocystinuria type D protein n=1 Tax=Stenomitos frigidus AS-A4 TaxID=2933935 RepID=A0ABV0KR96_9CYAN|nr:methylmalonic aciduria and homocystinuria type D protein [Phormidium sp. FACHB-592]